jgi:alpha-tubulin suppressor-like RCC1 family protein
VVISGTWSALAAAGHHTCAADSTGALSCWGANDIGQVTGAAGADQPSPLQIAPSAQQIIAGNGFTCALEGGAVACWGTNTGDQLGSTDTAVHQYTPITQGASKLIGGTRAACAATGAGQLCWGTIFGSGTFAPPQRLGGGVPLLVDVGFGRQTTCGIDAGTGKGVCWGYGYWGDLGDGVNHSDTMSYAPSPVMDADSYTAIAMTSDHACALADDATTGPGTVRCWGTNYSYDSANSGNPYVLIPTTLEDASSNPVRGCTSIAVSDAFSCATCNGGVQCWGLAQMGRLGRGDNAVNSEPAASAHMPTTGPWKQVALGPEHGCAIDSNGTLACWGLGARGEIGDGSHGSALPVLVPGPP